MIDRDERLVSEEIKSLEPILGKDTAAKIRRAYLLGDETIRERIFELLDAVKAVIVAKHGEDSLFIQPPTREVSSKGEIILGDVVYGNKNIYPVYLKKSDMLTHMGIFGSSGYGKTNISYSMINQLSENGVPVVVFDFSKRNYRDLLSTSLKSRIDIYTVGKNVSPFRFNPLRPPEGIPASQWMKEFSSIFDHAYWLLGGGRHVILKALDSTFKSKESPKLADIKDWLEKYSSSNMPARERNWLATAQRPLESLCFKELGEVFDCDEGLAPSSFFSPGKITILELDALDSSDKTFFIEIMLQWIRDWLLVSGTREILKGVIILEEAHHVLNREKSRKLGSETVIDLIFREIRELGLGMIYIDQHPSMVSYPALGNTSNHIYMNLGLDTQHSSDVQDASSMLGLNYEEQGSHLRRLPIGHGFMLRRNSDFRNPFGIKFPQFPITKGAVTDEHVRKLMQPRSPIKNSLQSKISPVKQAEKQNLEDVAYSLESRDWEILKILGSGQATFASQIYRLVNISGGMFKKRSQKLIEKGVIGMSSAKIRKNRMNYYYLTDLGEKIFSSSFRVREKPEAMELKNILETLTEDSWKCSLEKDMLTIRKGNQNLNIHLKNSLERGEFNPKETFLLCSSQAVKNLMLQKAARLSAEFSKSFTIFISAVKEFEETGELEEVEFII